MEEKRSGLEEAFRSQLRVMLSFVSSSLGPILVRMSRVAVDAVNTAASDDTDPMRQTDRHTDSRGSTLQKAEANYIWTPPPPIPCLQGAVRYNI